MNITAAPAKFKKKKERERESVVSEILGIIDTTAKTIKK
jgi:hypothetical protein